MILTLGACTHFTTRLAFCFVYLATIFSSARNFIDFTWYKAFYLNSFLADYSATDLCIALNTVCKSKKKKTPRFAKNEEWSRPASRKRERRREREAENICLIPRDFAVVVCLSLDPAAWLYLSFGKYSPKLSVFF